MSSASKHSQGFSALKCTSNLKMVKPQLVGPLVILWLIQFITGKQNLKLKTKNKSLFWVQFSNYNLMQLLYWNRKLTLNNHCKFNIDKLFQFQNILIFNIFQFWAIGTAILSTSLPSWDKLYTSTAMRTFQMMRWSLMWSSGKNEGAILLYLFGTFMFWICNL